MKIGVFGGTFNPPHNGHLNSLQTVLKKFGLDKILVVPAYQNPLKQETEGPSPEQRLEMVRRAVESWDQRIVVSDLEIKRKGKSYTFETLKEISVQEGGSELFLILGLDQFEQLDKWKSVGKILETTNLIVTSRPGHEFPKETNALPSVVRDSLVDWDFSFIELKSGKSVQFLQLEDVNVTATDLRKWLRIGKNVQKYLPLGVETYIREQSLYRNLGEKIRDYGQFTEFCARILFSKKGIQVRGFDLTALATTSDFTLLASGTSSRHTSALAENVMQAVKEEYNVYPQSAEGLAEGRWVVLDYGNLIIHVFYDFVRQEYALEQLWREGRDLGLKDPFLTEKT